MSNQPLSTDDPFDPFDPFGSEPFDENPFDEDVFEDDAGEDDSADLDDLFAQPTTLRVGDRGDDVRQLQELLRQHGQDLGAVDGIFGRRTEDAVRAFQRDRGLVADGIVGDNTWAALRDEPSTDSEPVDEPVPDEPLADQDQPMGEHGSEDVFDDVPSEESPDESPDAPTEDRWEDVPDDDRFRYVMERLVRVYGYPEAGAAGIVGNLWKESGILPNRVEGSRPTTPLRAANFAGEVVDFTPEQVRDRDRRARQGPRRPGVGLAQWTSAPRRAGLFSHEFEGVVHGADVLFEMDAQIDYLVTELATPDYRAVDRVVRDPSVTVEAAAAEVVYRFEIPGSVLERVDGEWRKLPRSDERVQQIFAERTRPGHRALSLHRN